MKRRPNDSPDAVTIRGTQRGRMLAKVERAEELAAELQEARDMAAKLMTKNDKQEEDWKDVVAKLMAKIEKQDAKIERLENKLGF